MLLPVIQIEIDRFASCYAICIFILEVLFSHYTFILISLFSPFCCDQLHEDEIDCTHEINLEATCKKQTDDLKEANKYIDIVEETNY